ncbi:hypothetical protein [Paenibacillus polymyxa]|uniref:hypothetical protein n=1 Tax=Paenibacillus polymyxa TaxID=1406 RepID=UPI00058A2B39|nr:hypothetical protein [Paenibacillus polymyxa]AJE54158.1 hypothetical protein RE92_24400 [Paenibacillus polymyxa]
MMKKFIVLIEKDFADRDYAGYVPALRIGAVGHTKEEMLENLKDIITIELGRRAELPEHEHEFGAVSVDFPVNN